MIPLSFDPSHRATLRFVVFVFKSYYYFLLLGLLLLLLLLLLPLLLLLLSLLLLLLYITYNCYKWYVIDTSCKAKLCLPLSMIPSR